MAFTEAKDFKIGRGTGLRLDRWRMQPLARLARRRLTLLNRIWLVALRAYLVLGNGPVLVRIVQLALGR